MLVLDLLECSRLEQCWRINFISATLTEICKLICAFESKQCLLDSIPTFLLKLCFYKLGPIITNLSLSFSLFLEEFLHSHSNKLFPAFSQKHLYPLIFPQLSFEFKPQLHFQNSRKLLTCFLFILLTAFFILMNLLFFKFTMALSLQWILVRTLHSFYLSFDKQVSETCKACYFHIRALRHIRTSLTIEASKTIAAAIVGSRLDFCNSLAGTSVSNLTRLQRVQNTLA